MGYLYAMCYEYTPTAAAILPAAFIPQPEVPMRSLDPADPLLRSDVAEMVQSAEAIEIELVSQAQAASSIVNSLRILAAASTVEMVQQQRDILWRLVFDCATNGWEHISEPVADFVMDTRPDAAKP